MHEFLHAAGNDLLPEQKPTGKLARWREGKSTTSFHLHSYQKTKISFSDSGVKQNNKKNQLWKLKCFVMHNIQQGEGGRNYEDLSAVIQYFMYI